MNLEVQWFAYEAARHGSLTLDTIRKLAEVLGPEADLLAFAQAVLDHQLCDDFDAIQNLAMDAQEAAAAGPPPVNVFEADLEAILEPGPAAPEAPAEPGEESSWEELQSMTVSAMKLPEQSGRQILELLRAARSLGASDLHLSAGAPPFVRLNRAVRFLAEEPLSAATAYALNTALLETAQRERFDQAHDLDLALALETGDRFRVNLSLHKEGTAGCYHLVPGKIRSLEELGFRNLKVLKKLLTHHNGLILVTGPVGCGKTTTLAALVDIVNRERHDHIITVEDPIEIVQYSQGCNVTQRQVGGVHTASFHSALKAALRENPDIIVIGELRDLETIEMAITAAETGHLVIGTLHTADAASTLSRLLDVFPVSQQAQIRAMTAESLRGIVCQRLLPTVTGGVAVAVEVLVNTIAVGNLIREGKTHQLQSVLQTGVSVGMCTMDQSIQSLYSKGVISQETALAYVGDRQVQRQIQSGLKEEGAAPAAASPDAKKKSWFR